MQASVVMNPRGDALVVWTRLEGKRIQVSARRAGGRWSAPQTLSDPRYRAGQPDLAINRAGDAIVVWTQRGARGHLVIQAVSRRGHRRFSRPVALSATGSDADRAQVAMNDAAEAVVGWESDRRRPPVRVVTRTATGRYSAPVDLAAGSSGTRPRAAIDARGDATVAWEGPVDRYATGAYVATRPAGGRFSGPTLVSGTAPGSARRPEVSVDSAGDATLAWLRAGYGDTTVVEAAVRAPGGRFSAPFALSTTGIATDPVLATSPAALVAVFTQYPAGSSYTTQAAIRPAGGVFGRPFSVSGTFAVSDRQAVAVDTTGRVLIAWMQLDDDRVASGVHAALGSAADGFKALAGIPDVGRDGGLAGVVIDDTGSSLLVLERTVARRLRVQVLGFDAGGRSGGG